MQSQTVERAASRRRLVQRRFNGARYFGDRRIRGEVCEKQL